MSQFAQSGSAMDEAQSSDGDGGFLSVNQRLQLNQLEVGEVRESLNGRMEGYWKPRRGIVARTGSLTSGGSPLQLPFFLIDVAKNYYNIIIKSEEQIRQNVIKVSSFTAPGINPPDTFVNPATISLLSQSV